MSSELIINKAKEDLEFRSKFLKLIIDGNDKNRSNFSKVKEYLEEELDNSFKDKDIFDAWGKINNFSKSKEKDQVTGASSSYDAPQKNRKDLNELLFDDLEIEYNRTKKLKDALSESLEEQLKDMKKSRNRIMNMYTIAFTLGVIMISISIIIAILSAYIPQYKDINLIALFAGLGAVNVVSSMIFRPARELQNMIIKSVQLIANFYTLINEAQTWNTYIKYGPKKSLEDIKSISNLRIKHLKDIILLMDKIPNEKPEDNFQSRDDEK